MKRRRTKVLDGEGIRKKEERKNFEQLLSDRQRTEWLSNNGDKPSFKHISLD